MTVSQLLALAPLLLSGALAQSDVKVWAAVAYINHGEKTPAVGDLDAILTPEGAQQLLRQGQAFRSRYLISGTNSGNGSSSTAIEHTPIQGISARTFRDDQVTVLSQSNQWASGSATAFLQGFYPPSDDAYSAAAGGQDLANNLVANSSASIEYPLGGYQYPIIQTLSARDSMSPAIQGTVGCNQWVEQMNTNLTLRPDMVNASTESLEFYQELFSSDALAGTVPSEDANFWHAYELYEYVRYMYTHNETVFNGLDNAEESIARLQQYAIDLERAMNSDPIAANDDPLNQLYSIAGRTLSNFVANQLAYHISEGGNNEKLTLMFGSFRPMLSFFSAAGISTREDTSTGLSSRIPEPGAAMVFELIDDRGEDATTLPDVENLSIRFYYRASANEDESFQGNSLFGSGFGGASIPFTAFHTQMMDRGRNSDDWCNICSPSLTTANWCATSSNRFADGDSSGGVSPAIAGVIGAVTTAVVVGIVLALLFFLCGFRLRRAGPQERASGLGGFKGPEKMASDVDLSVGKGGAAQERIGSWELQDEHTAPSSTGAGIVTSDFSRRRADEDGISIVGATPVSARESV